MTRDEAVNLLCGGPEGARHRVGWRVAGLRGLIVVAACQLSYATGSDQGGIEYVTRDFRMVLPRGFSEAPDLVQLAPNITSAFVLGDRSDDEADIILLVEKLGGTIGRKELDLKAVPAFQGRVFKVRWQGLDVDAFEVPETLGEISTLTYNVQIPLRRGAIQLKLVSAADHKPEMERLLPMVLAGLTGESNWIPSLLPFSFASSRGYGIVLLTLAILMDVAALTFFWRLSKRTPKGTILTIAIGIYAASWLLRGVRAREVLLLTGATRMLGVATFILGLIDFFRRRSCADEPGSKDPIEELPA